MKKKFIIYGTLLVVSVALVALLSKSVFADWEYDPSKFCDDGSQMCWVKTHCGDAGYPNSVQKKEPTRPTE